MAEIGQDISTAVQIAQEGGLVGIPTETVYGLAANALNEGAVQKIYNVKNRPHHNPLILHIAERDQLLTYVEDIPAKAQHLGEVFWPGPLTMILPRKQIVPDIVCSGLATVAIRIPDHPLTINLLQSLSFPLAAPSANPFGYISPTSAAHVNAQLGDHIDYILDGGVCTHGLESTILGFDGEKPAIYRFGAITQEQIEEELQMKVDAKHDAASAPLSPGMLPHHYAPKTPIRVVYNIREALKSYDLDRTGTISLEAQQKEVPLTHQIVLSGKGDLTEAGHRLYHALRLMDKLNLDIILVEKLPQKGLGVTMNDRLQRAERKQSYPYLEKAR